MAIQFLIEHVVKEKDHPHIIAKLLSKDKNFSLTEKSFLGDLEIESQIIQPRALDFEGKPRLDLFVFMPKEKDKIAEFKQGMTLELFPGDEIHFLEPWYKTEIDLTIELKKEINIGHILYNKEVKTIGRRQDNDDVLYEIYNSDFKYALVHLTWKGKRETNPYPHTRTFNDLLDVYNNLIVKDNKEWE